MTMLDLGLFETMLVRDGQPLHVDEHAARMARSAETLGFPSLDRDAFRAAAIRASEQKDDVALRIVYAEPEWNIIATTFAIPPATLARRIHGRAITLDPSFVRSLPQHKMTSYAVCTIALRNAIAAGADEALFVTRDGGVLEGTATNVFAVRDATLITAPVEAGILPGITRALVIDAAKRTGFTIEERVPLVDELKSGAFFTGSLTGIAPMRTLDGVPCADVDGVVNAIAAVRFATLG